MFKILLKYVSRSVLSIYLLLLSNITLCGRMLLIITRLCVCFPLVNKSIGLPSRREETRGVEKTRLRPVVPKGLWPNPRQFGCLAARAKLAFAAFRKMCTEQFARNLRSWTHFRLNTDGLRLWIQLTIHASPLGGMETLGKWALQIPATFSWPGEGSGVDTFWTGIYSRKMPRVLDFHK